MVCCSDLVGNQWPGLILSEGSWKDPVDPSELEHFLQIILIPGKILPWCNQSPISPKSKIVHLHSTYHALFAKMSFFCYYHCLLSFVSPNEDARKKAARVVGEEQFLVVHLNAPEEVCQQRHQAEQTASEDTPLESKVNYQEPKDADLVLDTAQLKPADCVAKVIEMLEAKEII